MGALGWDTSRRSTEALRQATFERLTAIAETRKRHVERYFSDLSAHVVALSNDESTIRAVEEFSAAWPQVPPLPPNSRELAALRRHYEMVNIGLEWFPADPRAQRMQSAFISDNPHPLYSKNLLLEAPQTGAYSRTHARYHPTLDRYRGAFGLYDIFLLDSRTGRILYTAFKELDLGSSLLEAPYSGTALARVFGRARELSDATAFTVEDYAPYVASHFAPAAFLAAPIRRAGLTIGVLAIQVSIEDVNRVMTGERRWRDEGLGKTGETYLVAADGTLRSDARAEVEDPAAYAEALRVAGVKPEIIAAVRKNGTAILTQPAPPDVSQRIATGAWGTEFGFDFGGNPVLRALSPLKFGDLGWTLVSEMSTGEALGPADALRRNALLIGLLTAAAFFLAGSVLAATITRPLRVLAEGARRLGGGEFGTRVHVSSTDELGDLAGSFNRMAENLERTTVSKDKLEALARQLIHAQEEERSRLARELHDDVTQRMAAVAIDAGALTNAPEERRRDLAVRIKNQIGSLSRDIHSLSRRLHPSILDDLGLASALQSECRAFTERTGIPIDCRLDAEDGIADAVQLTLYRIVQEALRNVQRHSEASRAELELVESADSVRLVVADNGRGFSREAPGWHPGLGLASMEERVKLHGGRVEVHSAPGQGTRIEVEIPRT
jgi:signal transduction histidine kinase